MLSLWKSFSFSELFNESFNFGVEHCKNADGTFVTTVDLPGVSETDVTVETSQGYVKVKGTKKTKTSSYCISKTFSVPKECNLDELKASFKNGVLTLSMPNKELTSQSEVKKIPITVDK